MSRRTHTNTKREKMNHETRRPDGLHLREPLLSVPILKAGRQRRDWRLTRRARQGNRVQDFGEDQLQTPVPTATATQITLRLLRSGGGQPQGFGTVFSSSERACRSPSRVSA